MWSCLFISLLCVYNVCLFVCLPVECLPCLILCPPLTPRVFKSLSVYIRHEDRIHNQQDNSSGIKQKLHTQGSCMCLYHNINHMLQGPYPMTNITTFKIKDIYNSWPSVLITFTSDRDNEITRIREPNICSNKSMEVKLAAISGTMTDQQTNTDRPMHGQNGS